MIKESAKELKKRFSQMGAEVTQKEIESKLDLLVNQYKVPEEEAKRTVFNQYLRDLKLQRVPTTSESQLVKIKDIIKDGMWVSLKAKVVKLWDNDKPSISQVGLLGDETGVIKFVCFAKSDLPPLEEGKSYIFTNLVTDSWQGKFSVKLNKTTTVVPTEDVPVVEAAPAAFKKVSEVLSSPEETVKNGMSVSLNAKVVQLWENENKAIAQAGLLGDDTGIIKFTSFAKSNLPMLEEGKSYSLTNMITDAWQGRYSVKLNKMTMVKQIADIKVADNDTTMTGAIVDVQQGSGLIKRCPECNRPLVKGACLDHGKQEGEYDLRVKAVLDDGKTAQDIILNQEMTYKVTGIDVKIAKKMAMDAVDPGVVMDELKHILLGKYYTVKGPKMTGGSLLVKDMEKAAVDTDLDQVFKVLEAI
jgi:replication factor A1